MRIDTRTYRGIGVDDGLWHEGALLHERGLLWIDDNGLHCQIEPSTLQPKVEHPVQLSLF